MNKKNIMWLGVVIISIILAAYFGAKSSPYYNESMWWIPIIVSIPMVLFIVIYFSLLNKYSK